MKPSLKEPFQRISAPGWSVEKRISLPVLLAAVLQLASILIWATWLEARVASLEKSNALGVDLATRFARVEERIDGIRREMELMRKGR